MIRDMIKRIIVNRLIPAEWQLSTIANKKRDIFERGKEYLELKLADYIQKLVNGVYCNRSLRDVLSSFSDCWYELGIETWKS